MATHASIGQFRSCTRHFAYLQAWYGASRGTPEHEHSDIPVPAVAPAQGVPLHHSGLQHCLQLLSGMQLMEFLVHVGLKEGSDVTKQALWWVRVIAALELGTGSTLLRRGQTKALAHSRKMLAELVSNKTPQDCWQLHAACWLSHMGQASTACM